MPDSLGDRMKRNYEDRYRMQLTRRTPVILRLDGRAFHTLTRACKKPFDLDLVNLMADTAAYIVNNIQGAVFSYTQSDEISIFIKDYTELDTSAWFDYNVQKMTSSSAAMASVFFSKRSWLGDGFFDSRVFNIPKEEVVNYFIWRQQDWTRNSLQMLARSYFTQKQLHGKNTAAMHEMLHEHHGVNWAELSDQLKNGTIHFPGDTRCWYSRFQDYRDHFEGVIA